MDTAKRPEDTQSEQRDGSPVKTLVLPRVRAHDPLLDHGYPPLTELKKGQAPERLPAPGSDDGRRDVRGEWMGCEEAAAIVGIKRTQMWRIASAGQINCVVMGTQKRPNYKFQREEVECYARERRADQILRKISRRHSSFHLMQEMARRGTLSPALAATLNEIQESRRRPGRGRLTNPLDLLRS
jgi:hypothetical protein